MSYEEASKQLEEIINKLENGNLPMSEAVVLFEEGQRLAKICYEHLNKVESQTSLFRSYVEKERISYDEYFTVAWKTSHGKH